MAVNLSQPNCFVYLAIELFLEDSLHSKLVVTLSMVWSNHTIMPVTVTSQVLVVLVYSVLEVSPMSGGLPSSCIPVTLHLVHVLE